MGKSLNINKRTQLLKITTDWLCVSWYPNEKGNRINFLRQMILKEQTYLFLRGNKAFFSCN